MFSGKEFCRSMACVAIGGIITVIFIKMLEWQRSQNHEDQEERGETRMIVPVEEIGEEERREERIVQGHKVKITKFPREKDDL